MTDPTVDQIIPIALEAGRIIMRVFHSSVEIDMKADRSPLTNADRAAHRCIVNGLNPTGIPILSEEGQEIPFAERRSWTRFWMVDPLDGTREFINRKTDFTVNIALIEEGRPVLGVVHVPATGVTYAAASGQGAVRINGEGQRERLPIAREDGPLRVVASRSHMSPETEAFCEGLRVKHGDIEIRSKGSSLKLCMIAEGSADIYPRLAPTMEWDTAAADAVVRECGGSVTDATSGEPLQYNKENLLNPFFIVRAAGY